MVFERLHPRLQQLLQDEGFEEPTPAQAAALPPIQRGEHVLVLAPTGLGKTEAALLPVLDRVLRMGDDRPHGFNVLYVTPLRALNRDIMSRMEDWGAALDLRVGVRHGDTTQYERTKQSRNPPDVLITTPESIQAMLTGSRLRRNLAGIRSVVVDEVHELLADERGSQLAVALERLVNLAGEFQRVGLSATVGDPDDAAAWLGGPTRDVRVMRVPVTKDLQVTVEAPAPTDDDTFLADEVYGSPRDAAEVRRLARAVDEHTSTLVFVNTRRTAEVLAVRLGYMGRDDVGVHHGSLSKDTRVEAEEAFKRGDLHGLICTSSMELGIDIGSADYVVQINSPREANRLVQRVGRAGHKLGLTSTGVVLAENADDVLEAAVIARRAMHGQLEAPQIPHQPLDVLANQVVAMLIEGDLAPAEALATLRRSHPFRDLDEATFDDVVGVLEGTRLVTRQEGQLRRRGRARVHHVENLSMIPDTTTFLVKDIASRRAVGTLDEAFVATYIERGNAFIFRGATWRVLDVEDDVILVGQVRDPTGAVPSWIGEEIPVPFEVAQDVGRARASIADALRSGGDPVAWMMERFPVDRAAAERAVELLREQGDAPVPSDTLATFETGRGVAVLNACLGHKGNEALGHAIASLTTARTGRTVGLDVDPYRIVFELPARVAPGRVRDVLDEVLQMPEGSLEPLLRTLLANAPILRFKLVHVARKFGVLDKDVDATRVNVNRVLDAFRDSPLYDEAVAEVLRERMDVAVAEAFLRDVREGRVELLGHGITPIGQAGIEESTGLVAPSKATGAILDAVRQRLLDEKVVLVCLHCREWTSRRRVRRIEFPVVCGNCGARQAAPLRPWQTHALKAVQRAPADRTTEQSKLVRGLHKAADLVLHYSRRAVMALVARGVGPDTAARILRRQREDEEEFLRDILDAEMTYARTRAFWES